MTRQPAGDRDARIRALASLIRSIPDFPREGILFRDVTTLLADAGGLRDAVGLMAEEWRGAGITRVAAVEARGFLLGAPLAMALGTGVVLARKPGKLPWRTARETYELEYGTDALEIHEDAIRPGERVLLVDDLLATGGTAAATISLIRRMGGEVAGASFLVELDDLGGRGRLAPVTVSALLHFPGH